MSGDDEDDWKGRAGEAEKLAAEELAAEKRDGEKLRATGKLARDKNLQAASRVFLLEVRRAATRLGLPVCYEAVEGAAELLVTHAIHDWRQERTPKEGT